MRFLLVLGLLFGIPFLGIIAVSLWPREVWTNFEYETTWSGELKATASGMILPRPNWGESVVIRQEVGDFAGDYYYLHPRTGDGLDYRTSDGRSGFLPGGIVTSGASHFRYFNNWSRAESRWQVAAISMESSGRLEADCFGYTQNAVTARTGDSSQVFQYDLMTPSREAPVDCTVFVYTDF